MVQRAQAVVATVVDEEVATSVVDVEAPADARTTAVGSGLDGDELFPIYSVTKTLIATAVMMLVEHGRIGLDDPVQNWLPHLPLGTPVTVRQLLNHTAGLPDYGAMPEYAAALRADAASPWSREDFLARTLGRGLVFPPGGGWAYSNVGYLCLVMLLEQEHGVPLGEVLRREIFAPLSLERTSVAVTPDDMAVLTPAWSRAISPDEEPVEVSRCYHPGWVSHGLVLSTAAELARLVDALFLGRLVGTESLDQMTGAVLLPFDHPLFGCPGYGLGLMVDAAAPGLLAGHGGGGPGYSAGALHVMDEGGGRVTAVALAASELGDVGLRLALEAARKEREVRAGRRRS